MVKLIALNVLLEKQNYKRNAVELIPGEDSCFSDFNISDFSIPEYYKWFAGMDYDEEPLTDLNFKIQKLCYEYLSGKEDILKIIYQSILPKTSRYRSGEYYTPDWLVEFSIESSGYKGALNETILDPCCGSGSFLFFAVNSFLEKNKTLSINPNQILKLIWGFDINPLAVISSKTNLLIALRKFLPFKEKIKFNIYKKDLLNPEEKREERFDYILGNPPWVNWKNMSEEYKQKIIPIAKRYELFEQTGLKARLGFAEDDISVILTYVSIDLFLKPGGRIAFILPQSLFQSVGGGSGFRKFYLSNSSVDIGIEKVIDLVKISPFKTASNRTALFIAKKGMKTVYPVKYEIFKKNQNGLKVYENLDEFKLKTSKSDITAEPVDIHDLRSPWVLSPDKEIKKLLNYLMCPSDYKARAGVCTWMSGVYWLDILQRNEGYYLVSNNPANGKIKVKQVMRNVDSDVVYPLIRGRDVKRWNAQYSGNIIFPQLVENPSSAIPEEKMKSDFKLSYDYFSQFKELLLERKGYKKFLFKQPFYAVYDAGKYSMAKYKVGWRYLSKKMDAAIIKGNYNNEIILPDLNVITIEAESMEEAFYISALLNSSVVQLIIKAYGECLRITPGIMRYIPIKKFDIKSDLPLSELSEQAHNQFNDQKKVEAIEKEIDYIYAHKLGINEKDLKRIKDYLNEN